jgi:hypothetical protein
MNYIASQIDFYPLINSDDIVLTRIFQRSDWDENVCLNVEIANDILNAINIKYQGSVSKFKQNVSIDDFLNHLKYYNNNEINRMSILFCTDFDNSEITNQWSTQSYNLILQNMKLEQQEDERNYFEKEKKIEG